MMRYLVVILVLLTGIGPVGAQPARWLPGVITLHTDEALSGPVRYNWQAEIVQLKTDDGRIRAFSADQVASFTIEDGQLTTVRRFVALPLPVDRADRRHPVFFETYIDGPLTVVRRLRQRNGLLRTRINKPDRQPADEVLKTSYDAFSYYVYDGDQFRSVDRFYTDVYEPLMTAYDRPLMRYVQTHGLNPKAVVTRLMLIQHYNALRQGETTSASVKTGLAAE